MIQKLNFIFILIICHCQFSFSQVQEEKKDTTEMYRDIQAYSKKNNFTKFMHRLIFKPFIIQKKVKKIIVRKKYRDFEGKIIRNITIVTLDPFGFSEMDTTSSTENLLANAGNRVHFKSKKLTIQNLLLFRKNKPLDSLLVKESERLIRSQSYIRAVNTTLKLTAPKSDSVDVYMRVLDSWSIVPKIEVTDSKYNVGLDERNFIGMGHRLETNFKKRYSDGNNAYYTKYTIPNIRNTYIKTTINYQIDLDNNYEKIFNIERPFFSPFTKWSAGIDLSQRFETEFFTDVDSVFVKQNFKYNVEDFWCGNAIHIIKGDSEKERTTNLITTARFLKINYLESPALAYDKIDFFSNEKFYLVGIGISSRQYVEDKFIFNYQIIEDVPVGRVLGITGGYQTKNNNSRFYAGARISSGKYYTWGFLSSNLEYGTFLNHSKPDQSVFTFQTNYFTNLFEIGKWKFRQFVKPQVIIGNDRQASDADRLTLNGIGISGFPTIHQLGTKKIFLSFQTQSYSPHNLLGFRFNPYFNCSLGMLGNGQSGFKKSNVYSQFGVGIIIKNDYLVFKSFQLSLVYYPSVSENGISIFKINGINSEDFGFQKFEINKPEVVLYK